MDLKEILKAVALPQCPLCRMRMEKAYDGVRKLDVFCCHRCRIAIRQDDPLVGKWDDPKREAVPCPICNANMLVFFTSVGYMKAVCPKKKCRATVTTHEVKADKIPGAKNGMWTTGGKA
jgi:hypothetical protein